MWGRTITAWSSVSFVRIAVPILAIVVVHTTGAARTLRHSIIFAAPIMQTDLIRLLFEAVRVLDLGCRASASVVNRLVQQCAEGFPSQSHVGERE